MDVVELTTVSPVPFGAILMLPLVSVEDMVLPSRRRLSTFRIPVTLLVPVCASAPLIVS